MTNQAAYKMALYDDANDDLIASLNVSFLPYPGLVITCGVGTWKVERVQVGIAARGSIADIRNEPPLVDVMVTRSEGIHHK